MIRTESVPDANAPPEHHADFLEFSALRGATGGFAFQEYVRDLGIGNPAEVVADSSDPDNSAGFRNPGDAGNQGEAVAIAQAAFDELDERRRNFGERSAHYPFEITPTRVNMREKGDESLYTFLSLLSWFGKDAGPRGTDGEKIFEEACANAAEAYLGGPSERVKSFVFGFPRRVQPAGFAQALDALRKSLGEGGGHRRGRPKLPDQKDAKLDIAAWVEFLDFRQGKAIAFGQCATGRNREAKLSELRNPQQWCGHWMADTPTVPPLRSFFVPHRVERDNWSHASTFGGLLFDRCRIASLAGDVGGDLKVQWARWAARVLQDIRRTRP